MEKMSWKELADFLCEHHDRQGVVVFKQHPKWKRQDYSLEELSYVVDGDNKFFYGNMISTSIWASNLSKTDIGVRLDWYMFYENAEDRWQVDYCYLLDVKED